MSLNSAISLEVGEGRDLVVDGCHDRHDTWRREHSMSPSTIFNVGCPAFSGAEVEYRVKINIFVNSELRQTLHLSSIAPGVKLLCLSSRQMFVEPRPVELHEFTVVVESTLNP